MRTRLRRQRHKNESINERLSASIQPRPFNDPYDNHSQLQAHDLSHVDLFSHAPQRGVIQAKLTVGQPNDRYEQEADRVASQIINMPASATQQMASRTSDQTSRNKPIAQNNQLNLNIHAASPSMLQCVYVPPDQQRVNVGKVYKMKMCWYDAALNLLRKKTPANAINPAIQTLITRYLGEVLNCQMRLNDTTPIIGDNYLEQHFPKGLPGALAGEIRGAVFGTLDAIKQELRNEFIRVLNNRNWAPIVKQLNFGSAHNPEYYTSTITPVNENYHETYGGGLGKHYGQTGLNSMSTQNRLTDLDQTERNRTTNLAYTEYRTGQANANGEVLFAAFRSGSLSGKSIKDDNDEDANWKATLANTKELLQAMVIKHLQEASPQDRLRMLGGHEVAKIPVLSTSLQSSGPIGGETRQIQEQIRALQSFDYNTNGRRHLIDVVWTLNGRQEKRYVIAEFDIIAMNLGVNAQGGWIGNKQDNEAAIARLGQAVTNYITMSNGVISLLLMQYGNMGPHVQRIAEIQTKNRQINQLWEKVQAGKGAKQSYKLAARIANLAFLIGYMVHFNCKSGKDRTGLQDAEAKFLAMEMHRAKTRNEQQIVPEHTLGRNNQQRRDDHQKMLFESGSLEMQEYNTGGQGYKIAPGAPVVTDDRALMERVGGKQVLTELQGLKRYTDIDKI